MKINLFNLSGNLDLGEINLTSISILSGTIFFIIYWFVSSSPKVRHYFESRYSSKNASLFNFIFQKFFGFICLGLIPLLLCLSFEPSSTFSQYGLGLNMEMAGFSLQWVVGFSIVAIPTVIWRSKQPKNLETYPQIRWPMWDFTIVLINIAGWAIYLLGYELLFRGILLFPLVEQIGIYPTIAINISLYAATHLPKGLDETVGALLLGFVLCLLTIVSGMIWIAYSIHMVVAMTNSFTAFTYHTDMQYRWKKG